MFHLKNYQFQLKKNENLIRWVYCIFWGIQLIIINAGRLNSLQFVNDLSEVIDTPFSIAKKRSWYTDRLLYHLTNVLCQCQKWCIRSWLSDSSGNSAAYLFARRLKHMFDFNEMSKMESSTCVCQLIGKESKTICHPGIMLHQQHVATWTSVHTLDQLNCKIVAQY